MKRVKKFLTGRLMIVIPLVLAQFALFAGILLGIAHFTGLLQSLSFISVCFCVYVINRSDDPSYKIAWIIVILGAPLIGIPLYLLAGNRKVPKKLAKGTTKADQKMEGLLEENEDVLHEASHEDPSIGNIFRYAYNTYGFPVYKNTTSKYYKSGEEWLPDYIEALKSAETYILMEYFIIDEGTLWDEILTILKEKAASGVRVKLIYDDFGSFTLPSDYPLQLKEFGIDAYCFNPIRPALIVQMNNRDHRKMTIIDNRIAFTGGLNLADEYVNREARFGYWKDSAIRIEGEAVWSFTVQFLGMLSYMRGDTGHVNYQKYKLPCEKVSDGGFYQPFSDTPTDSDWLSLNLHVHMISHARKYIYIDTPYLILTEEMRQALIRAAKSGVDVRIMTPAIPDKKTVFQITRGHYERLVMNGVRIYEYTPGFVHAKNFVSDDNLAIVGSVNTDYRSYFLHFENGVLMHKTSEIDCIKQDFLDSIKESHEVTEEEVKSEWLLIKIMRAILNVFIPLV